MLKYTNKYIKQIISQTKNKQKCSFKLKECFYIENAIKCHENISVSVGFFQIKM